MKTYNLNITLSKEGIGSFKSLNNKISYIFKSDAFYEYLGEKCKNALEMIQIAMINDVPDDVEMSNYLSSNHFEYDKASKTLLMYNDATIDVASLDTFFSETSKERYPAKLSLAKMLEYGTGYIGASTPHQEEVENWEYDVNGHGVQGWFYKGADGRAVWTSGYEGKLIFFRTKEYIQKHISEWVAEYLIKKLN